MFCRKFDYFLCLSINKLRLEQSNCKKIASKSDFTFVTRIIQGQLVMIVGLFVDVILVLRPKEDNGTNTCVGRGDLIDFEKVLEEISLT